MSFVSGLGKTLSFVLGVIWLLMIWAVAKHLGYFLWLVYLLALPTLLFLPIAYGMIYVGNYVWNIFNKDRKDEFSNKIMFDDENRFAMAWLPISVCIIITLYLGPALLIILQEHAPSVIR